MPVGNVKRAFNRLFMVCAVGWAAYCLIIFPIQQRREALDRYSKDWQLCYANSSKPERTDCLKQAEDMRRLSLDQWSAKNFYIGDFWLLLIAVVGLPLLVYGITRGLAAVCLWIWSGYKTA